MSLNLFKRWIRAFDFMRHAERNDDASGAAFQLSFGQGGLWEKVEPYLLSTTFQLFLVIILNSMCPFSHMFA
jgi:hypothetical protein